MKDRLNVTIESGLKQKAEEQNMNISKAVEQVLKEKTATRDSINILVVDKYGILLDGMNYTVARKNPKFSTTDVHSREFDGSTYTFHPNLHQALIQLSKRLLEDKLKVACKDKPLELKELAKLIEAHHEWFVNIVKGM